MRQRSSTRILFAVAVLVGSLALLGCPKEPEVTQAPPPTTGPGPQVTPGQPTPPVRPGEVPVAPRPAPRVETPITPPPTVSIVPPPTPVPGSPLKDVFFDYDKASIRDDQKAGLNENVTWLKANTKAKITLEGHCDERGTAEYNLGLGERRARALKDYMVAAGIPADRVATISYGKERPFVLGHDESAWKWNRRGHYAITAQ